MLCNIYRAFSLNLRCRLGAAAAFCVFTINDYKLVFLINILSRPNLELNRFNLAVYFHYKKSSNEAIFYGKDSR